VWGSNDAAPQRDIGGDDGGCNCGSCHDFRILLMSSSRENFPSSTAFRTAIAATGLLIDAAWNTVSGVTGAPVSTSATP